MGFGGKAVLGETPFQKSAFSKLSPVAKALRDRGITTRTTGAGIAQGNN